MSKIKDIFCSLIFIFIITYPFNLKSQDTSGCAVQLEVAKEQWEETRDEVTDQTVTEVGTSWTFFLVPAFGVAEELMMGEAGADIYDLWEKADLIKDANEYSDELAHADSVYAAQREEYGNCSSQ